MYRVARDLNKAEKYIRYNNKRPSENSKDKDEKYLGQWISHQKKNYKKQTEGMKDAERRKKWEDFMTNYSELFMTLDEVWDENLNKAEKYIRDNNKRPSENSKDKDEKYLGQWISNQKNNYKNQTGGMKDAERRKKWDDFVKQYPKQFPNYQFISLSESSDRENKSVDTSEEDNASDTESIASTISSVLSNSSIKSSSTKSITSKKSDKTTTTKSSTRSSQKSKCEGIVKKTKQPCTFSAQPDSKYCKVHQPKTRISQEDEKSYPPPNQKITSLEQLTTEEQKKLLDLYNQKNKSYPNGYQATNPADKDYINKILRECSPKNGLHIFLDHKDFRTSKELLKVVSPKNILIPQKDQEHYNIMKTDSELGKQVVNCDLIDIPRQPISLMYADICGSIKEATPIIEKFHKCIVSGGIFAITISCRDGEESRYTNEFMAKLVKKLATVFGDYEEIYNQTYGEHTRMGTIILKKIKTDIM